MTHDAVEATASDAAYAIVPEPGRTIDATPAAAEEMSDLTGYRMALVIPDDDPVTVALRDAVRDFARERGAVLVEVTAATADPDDLDAALLKAIDDAPDVVLGIGEAVTGVYSLTTAQWLDQEFLMIGAELAEPTANVTAVIWPGTPAPAGDADESELLEEVAFEALTVGIESVRDGLTGVVLHLGAIADRD